MLEWGIREWNEGNDRNVGNQGGNAGNQGGMWEIRVGCGVSGWKWGN